ncbi:unnamed protein product, partial [Phaeothamnion confervicola]
DAAGSGSGWASFFSRHGSPHLPAETLPQPTVTAAVSPPPSAAAAAATAEIEAGASPGAARSRAHVMRGGGGGGAVGINGGGISPARNPYRHRHERRDSGSGATNGYVDNEYGYGSSKGVVISENGVRANGGPTAAAVAALVEAMAAGNNNQRPRSIMCPDERGGGDHRLQVVLESADDGGATAGDDDDDNDGGGSGNDCGNEDSSVLATADAAAADAMAELPQGWASEPSGPRDFRSMPLDDSLPLLPHPPPAPAGPPRLLHSRTYAVEDPNPAAAAPILLAPDRDRIQVSRFYSDTEFVAAGAATAAAAAGPNLNASGGSGGTGVGGVGGGGASGWHGGWGGAGGQEGLFGNTMGRGRRVARQATAGALNATAGALHGVGAGVDRVVGAGVEAVERGVEVLDRGAHAVGINKIPVIRRYLWGQVHTGFWDSYQVVRPHVHRMVKKALLDWLLDGEDHPDLTVYVTGHSLGGALATHCALDLETYVLRPVNERLQHIGKARRTALRGVLEPFAGAFRTTRGLGGPPAPGPGQGQGPVAPPRNFSAGADVAAMGSEAASDDGSVNRVRGSGGVSGGGGSTGGARKGGGRTGGSSGGSSGSLGGTGKRRMTHPPNTGAGEAAAAVAAATATALGEAQSPVAAGTAIAAKLDAAAGATTPRRALAPPLRTRRGSTGEAATSSASPSPTRWLAGALRNPLAHGKLKPVLPSENGGGGGECDVECGGAELSDQKEEQSAVWFDFPPLTARLARLNPANFSLPGFG